MTWTKTCPKNEDVCRGSQRKVCKWASSTRLLSFICLITFCHRHGDDGGDTHNDGDEDDDADDDRNDDTHGDHDDDTQSQSHDKSDHQHKHKEQVEHQKCI